MSPDVTHARRKIIASILRREARPMTSGEILAELRKVHAEGKWPQAEWAGARNEPYPGTMQLVESMKRCRNYGLVMSTPYGTPGPRKWWMATPEELLPQGDEREQVQQALDFFAADTGRQALVGVDKHGIRVVRIDSGRGVIEIELKARWSWMDGLKEAGLA